MYEDPITEELRIVQTEREHAERDAAQRSPVPEETRQHERRAERAAYLREKLEQRAASERDAG